MPFHLATWAAAAAYVWMLGRANRLAKVLLKPLPIYLLIGLAINKGAPSSTPGLLLIIALACSAAGDLLLLFEKHFALGLIAFLLAHLAYIAALFTPTTNWLPLPALLLIGLAVGRLLRPGAIAQGGPQLFAAVSLYLATILTMLWQAISFGHPLALAGALSFVGSDFALAYNRFVRAIPYRDYIVILSYYLAQYLLTLSLTGA